MWRATEMATPVVSRYALTRVRTQRHVSAGVGAQGGLGGDVTAERGEHAANADRVVLAAVAARSAAGPAGGIGNPTVPQTMSIATPARKHRRQRPAMTGDRRRVVSEVMRGLA